MTDIRHDDEKRPAPLDWRRLTRMLRPIRGGLVAMVSCSTGGVLLGLVPPLALGALVNALVEREDTAEGALLAGVVGLAILAEAAAYVVSDGLYARNASRLYRDIRVKMFEGARRRRLDEEEKSGLASRFISDAESIGAPVSLLDSGTMLIVEFVSAIVLLGIMSPWTIPIVVPELALTWIITRRMQEPAATAGQRRQEALESMTRTIFRGLVDDDGAASLARFKSVADRVLGAEVRVGWLQSINAQGSGGLAKLGPIAAVVTTAFAGGRLVGTLIAVYLVAQRVFWGFDGMVDISLGLQTVRGAVGRCFQLVDTPADDGDGSPEQTSTLPELKATG